MKILLRDVVAGVPALLRRDRPGAGATRARRAPCRADGPRRQAGAARLRSCSADRPRDRRRHWCRRERRLDGAWLARVRGTMDFVRYLHPRLARAPLLRARVKRQALPWTLQWLDRVRALPPGLVERLMRGLAAVERAIPPARRCVGFLGRAGTRRRAGVAARRARLRSGGSRARGAGVARHPRRHAGRQLGQPDQQGRSEAWPPASWRSGTRRRSAEASSSTACPSQAVVVTGAQAFDRWFDRRAVARARASSAATVGLPAGRPFVLFTGSSIFIARAEVEMPFVRRWIEALRASERSARPRPRRAGAPAPLQRPGLARPSASTAWTAWRCGRAAATTRWTTPTGSACSTRCTTATPSSASTRAR